MKKRNVVLLVLFLAALVLTAVVYAGPDDVPYYVNMTAGEEAFIICGNPTGGTVAFIEVEPGVYHGRCVVNVTGMLP